MNLKDYAEQALPLLAAIKEGGTIQYRSRLQDAKHPIDWADSRPEDEGVECLNLDRFEYRVKPVDELGSIPSWAPDEVEVLIEKPRNGGFRIGAAYAEWESKPMASGLFDMVRYVRADLVPAKVSRDPFDDLPRVQCGAVAPTDSPAPTVTQSDVDDEILAEQFHVFPGTTMTVCALTLRNGYVVTGESAAASPANFNVELGQQIARRKAVEKIWPLLGFRLRDKLHAEEYPF